MKFVLFFSLLISVKLYAHGDHHIPGAIPPSPNGGVLEEAKHHHGHSHKHDHGEAEEREIFYEAKYSNKEILIFPLQLDPKTNKSFIALDTKSFSKLKIEVKDARKNKVVAKDFERMVKNWKIDASKIRGRRLIISVSGNYKGANYKANVQVERK